jgi:hypothetical protein
MKYFYPSLHKNAVFVLIGLLALLNSCTRKLYFEQSSIVPAARGVVKIKTDRNKNYSMDISVLHLAEPERLQQHGNTYVVWMETGPGNVKNIGQIKSTNSFLSKTLKGSLKTVTPLRPEKIFITVEEDPAITYPNGKAVLTTRNPGKE